MAKTAVMAELEATDKAVEMGGMEETTQLRAMATMEEMQRQEAMEMGATAVAVVSMVVMGAMEETVTAEGMAAKVEKVGVVVLMVAAMVMMDGAQFNQ